jgi:hypothetical protein
MDQRVAAKPQATATPSALSEFRRGWSSVLAAALGVGVGTTGLPFYSFGLLIAPLSAAYGWSRGQIGLGMTCLSLGATCSRRFWERRSTGSACAASRWCRWQALPSALPCWPLRSARYRPSMRRGSRWHFWGLALRRSRGRARSRCCSIAGAAWLGLTLLGTGLVALIGAAAAGRGYRHLGPRGGYLAMAGVVVLVVMPVVAAGLREGPSGRSDAVPHPRSGLTRQQALRSRQFWQIAIGVFLLIVAQSGATVHLVPFLADHGLTLALPPRWQDRLGFRSSSGAW